DGVWAIDRRIRMPGGAVLPARTTVLRLPSRGLLVVSPPLDVAGLEQLDSIGRVEEVLAPNPFHYLGVAACLARHPGARFRGAPRLFDRFAWRLAGVPRRFGPSLSARVVLLRERSVVAAFLRRVLGWPFRRVLVAHGGALEADARATVRRA